LAAIYRTSANNAASIAGVFAASASVANVSAQAALSALNARITFGTAVPTGGSNGDIYFQYT
jgi:hypothetical protein